MPSVTSGAREGLVIASGVLLVTAIFAWRQWVERVRREEDLSEADQDHFRRKDWRRFFGTTILGLIGVGMVVGSLLDFRASKAAGQRFLAVWVGIAVLVCVSLVLAMIDWTATRDYALRHRRELAEVRRALFDEEVRLRDAARNETRGSNGASCDVDSGETTVG